jgi:hypothetical protein
MENKFHKVTDDFVNVCYDDVKKFLSRKQFRTDVRAHSGEMIICELQVWYRISDIYRLWEYTEQRDKILHNRIEFSIIGEGYLCPHITYDVTVKLPDDFKLLQYDEEFPALDSGKIIGNISVGSRQFKRIPRLLSK